MTNVEKDLITVRKISIPNRGQIYQANCGIPNSLIVQNRENGKLGLIDIDGNVIIPCKYKGLDKFIDNCAAFSKKDGDYDYNYIKGGPEYYGTRGFINEKGEILFSGKYTALGSMNAGLARFNRFNECGYIDSNFNEIILTNYDNVDSYYDGCARVCRGESQGYIDTFGNEITSCIYTFARRFHEGMAAVSRDGHKWGYINNKGEEVIKCQYDDAYDFKEGFAIVWKESFGYKKHILIDKQGHEFFDWFVYNADNNWKHDGFSDGLIHVWKVKKNSIGTEDAFIDTNLNSVIEVPSYPYHFEPFSDGMAAFDENGGKYGFINKQGEIVCPPQFTGIPLWFENGYTSVIKDSNKFIIDKSGREIYKFKTNKGFMYRNDSHTDGIIIKENNRNYVLKLDDYNMCDDANNTYRSILSKKIEQERELEEQFRQSQLRLKRGKKSPFN